MRCVCCVLVQGGRWAGSVVDQSLWHGSGKDEQAERSQDGSQTLRGVCEFSVEHRRHCRIASRGRFQRWTGDTTSSLLLTIPAKHSWASPLS